MSGRRQPRLIVELRLEERPRILLDVASSEDELRLRRWLRGSGALATLARALPRLLDELDELERRNAA